MNLNQIILAEGKETSELRSKTRILAEVSVSVALAVVLNQVKIFHLPQGGSITLGSMVPILLIAFRHGLLVGINAGVVFGLVQMIIEGYIYYPFQIILDYPLAFGTLGLAGFFKKHPLIGVIVALSGRFLSHFISGVLFFAEYAGDMNPFIYSAIYNGSYLLPEMIISCVLIYMLFQRDILNINI